MTYIEELIVKLNYDGPIKKEDEFYILNNNLAIAIYEFDKHSQKQGNKTAQYHKNIKEQNALRAVETIQIFEDEWNTKKSVVLNKINIKLKCFTGRKIHARKCTIQDISSKMCKDFLNKYHLQGADNSAIRLGLFYTGELIGVMTFSKPSISKGRIAAKNISTNMYELNRFASKDDIICVGAGNKLLHYFEVNYKPEKIITYADRRWSPDTNNLYNILKFTEIRKGAPSYWYFKIGEHLRKHRFNFTKKKTIKMGGSTSNTEWENMMSFGYDRIFDCGTCVYEKEYNYGYSRRCPNCNDIIIHTKKYNRDRLDNKKSLCKECVKVILSDIAKNRLVRNWNKSNYTSWKRNCPKCGKLLFYSSKGNKDKANVKNSTCMNCKNNYTPELRAKISNSLKGRKWNNRKSNTKFDKMMTEFRICPNCSKKMGYTTLYNKNRADKNNTICNSCSSYKYGKNWKNIIKPEHVQKMAATKAGYNTWDEYQDDLPAKKKYYNEVWKLTRQQDLSGLDNSDKLRTLCGVENGYQLDHIISVKYGFENDIPPDKIADITNLQFIPWKINLIKSNKACLAK